MEPGNFVGVGYERAGHGTNVDPLDDGESDNDGEYGIMVFGTVEDAGCTVLDYLPGREELGRSTNKAFA